MHPDVSLRSATGADLPFLTLMLVEAVNWAPSRAIPLAAVLGEPSLAHYVAGWPGPEEIGVVATEADRPLGAAWLRFFDEADPGFGFVAAETPELSLAVTAPWRRRGVGRALLRDLAARARRAGITAVSLSVERANPASLLYRAEGFVVVGNDGDADIMVQRLD